MPNQNVISAYEPESPVFCHSDRNEVESKNLGVNVYEKAFHIHRNLLAVFGLQFRCGVIVSDGG